MAWSVWSLEGLAQPQFSGPGPEGESRSVVEACLTDGQRLSGRLRPGPKGWSFLSAAAKQNWSLQQLDQVVFPPPGTARPYQPPFHYLLLPRKQQLAGTFLEATDKKVNFRTAWGQALEVPRPVVVGVIQPPGWLTVAYHDFEKDMRGWETLGNPVLSGTRARSGKQSLLLDGATQKSRYQPAASVAAGRLDLFFLAAGSAPWRSRVDLGFACKKKARNLSLQLSNHGYFVEAALPPVKLPASAGWHHLQVDFASRRQAISVDDRVLWENDSPDNWELQQVELASLEGAAWFDDFRLSRAWPPQKRHPGLLDSDELWLASGDQLFGQLLRGDARQVEFQAHSQAATFGWEQLRGIFFRPQPGPPVLTSGEHVRLWLRGGRGQPDDEIVGVLHDLNDRQLLLRHHLLGLLAIERDYLVRLRSLFRGRRLEVENNLVALGPTGQVLAGPQALKVVGQTWKKTFILEAAPATAELVLEVLQLPGKHEGVSSKNAGAALCTAAYCNNVLVGYLNDHVQRATRQPLEIRLPLARNLLRAGANVLEFRQIAEPKTGQVSTCGINNVVLAMPE